MIVENNLSYPQVGGMIDVDSSSVYKWCSGKKGISAEHLLNLSELLDCDIYDLLVIEEVEQ